MLLAVSFACGMWYYTSHVLIPYEKLDAAERGVPRGNLSDLYPRWLGARELLLHRRNPYSPEITREIQRGFYGRPLTANNPADPKDQEGFAYPLYVVFLLAPTVLMPFETARLVLKGVLLALTVASVPMWFYVLRLRSDATRLIIAIALTLASFPIVQGIYLQQLGLLVAFLVVGGLAALVRGRLALAGSLLAIATIKPQMVALTVIWLCLWAAAEWRQRRMFVVAFAATMAVLLAASEILLPHWWFYFVAATREYVGYTQGKSVLTALFTPVGGVVLTIVLLCGLARIWWKSRHEPADSPAFGLTTAVTLCVTLVVIPENVPHLQVILLPALLWLWFENDVARRAVVTGILRRVPFLLLAWSWVTALALDLLGRWLPAGPSVWVVLPLLGAGLLPIATLAAVLPVAWRRRAT